MRYYLKSGDRVISTLNRLTVLCDDDGNFWRFEHESAMDDLYYDGQLLNWDDDKQNYYIGEDEEDMI